MGHLNVYLSNNPDWRDGELPNERTIWTCPWLHIEASSVADIREDIADELSLRHGHFVWGPGLLLAFHAKWNLINEEMVIADLIDGYRNRGRIEDAAKLYALIGRMDSTYGVLGIKSKADKKRVRQALGRREKRYNRRY